MPRNIEMFRIRLLCPMIFVAPCGSNVPEEVEITSEYLSGKVAFDFHAKIVLSDRCYSYRGVDSNTHKEQKPITAFNKNQPMTAEGRAIKVEFRLNCIDREHLGFKTQYRSYRLPHVHGEIVKEILA